MQLTLERLRPQELGVSAVVVVGDGDIPLETKGSKNGMKNHGRADQDGVMTRL